MIPKAWIRRINSSGTAFIIHTSLPSQICRDLGADYNLHMPLQLPYSARVLCWPGDLPYSLALVIELDANTHAGCLAVLCCPNWST